VTVGAANNPPGAGAQGGDRARCGLLIDRHRHRHGGGGGGLDSVPWLRRRRRRRRRREVPGGGGGGCDGGGGGGVAG
jgi:hypothetical protein